MDLQNPKEIGAEVTKHLLNLIRKTNDKNTSVALKQILFYINIVTNNLMTVEEERVLFGDGELSSQDSQTISSNFLNEKETKGNVKPKKIITKLKDYIVMSTIEELENEKEENKQLRKTITHWIKEKKFYRLVTEEIDFEVSENIKKSIQKIEEFCLANRNVKKYTILQKGMDDIPTNFFSNTIHNLGLLKKQVVEVMKKIKEFEKHVEVKYLSNVRDITIANENLKAEKIKIRNDNQYLLYQNKSLVERVLKLQGDLVKMANDNSKIKHILSKRLGKKNY